MLTSLQKLISTAEKTESVVLGFNVFGYEDAVSILEAAEAQHCPVILMVNRVALKHMPLDILAPILLTLAEQASVPVCVHLDHALELGPIEKALDAGFTSVMFDGSSRPLEENIQMTQKVIRMAEPYHASVEAEIGVVGYQGTDVESQLTSPAMAIEFSQKAPVDALAVSVGNLHRLTSKVSEINFPLLEEIHHSVDIPLVIHGASGIPIDTLAKLPAYGVRKINIGTTLRMAFGNSLRQQMEADSALFDRVEMFQPAMEAVKKETEHLFSQVNINV